MTLTRDVIDSNKGRDGLLTWEVIGSNKGRGLLLGTAHRDAHRGQPPRDGRPVQVPHPCPRAHVSATRSHHFTALSAVAVLRRCHSATRLSCTPCPLLGFPLVSHTAAAAARAAFGFDANRDQGDVLCCLAEDAAPGLRFPASAGETAGAGCCLSRISGRGGHPLTHSAAGGTPQTLDRSHVLSPVPSHEPPRAPATHRKRRGAAARRWPRASLGRRRGAGRRT